MANKPERNLKLVRNVVLNLAAAAVVVLSFIQLRQSTGPGKPADSSEPSIIAGSFKVEKSRSEPDWKKILTVEQYRVMREAGTELPFTGKLNGEKRKGIYYSPGCGIPLFSSEQKYDSGTGWPSFWAPIGKDSLVLRRENGIGDDRIEVLDPCGNHLGHVFDDGPPPTGKRYCINSAALEFVPEK